MRIVITGANGFAGSHLSHWFSSKGYEVVALSRKNCDLRNLGQVTERLHSIAPDYILHLASKTVSGREIGDTHEQIEGNIVTVANICLAAPESVRLLLMFGSIEEYGNNQPPFTEEMTPSIISVYGWSKISAAALAKTLCERRSIPYTWLRPSLFFGPRASEKLFFGHVLNKCLRGETVPLTACEQTRDFLYVEDLARMVECLLEDVARAQGQIWNICSGEPRRLREVAELIQRLVGRGQLEFGAVPYRDNEVMDFYSDPSRFRAAYPSCPMTDFEEAVKRTVDEALAR